jgi:hypothetical protein
MIILQVSESLCWVSQKDAQPNLHLFVSTLTKFL